MEKSKIEKKNIFKVKFLFITAGIFSRYLIRIFIVSFKPLDIVESRSLPYSK